jgi:hypothetical protein
VGFGVQGMKAEIIGLLSGNASAIMSAGADEMKTIDQLPGTGNWTIPTLRNWLPDWLKMVSNTCFRPLWIPRTSGAIEHPLAKPHQRTADEIGGQEPEQSEPDDCNEDAKLGNMERQIAVGREDVRQPGPHPIVDRVDDPPGDVGGDRNWPNTMSPVKNQERSRWTKERWTGIGK